MDILRHRPLFLCCAVFMLSAVAGFPLNAAGKCVLGALVLSGTVLYACLTCACRKNTYRTVLAVTAGILACLALLRSGLTFHSDTRSYLQSLEQTDARVEATVTDRRGSGGYLTAYTLSLDKVNGRPAHGLALLTCHYVSDLSPGNEISLQATLIPLADAAGEGYDATALLGDGYVIGLLSEDESSVTVTKEHSIAFPVRVKKLCRTLAARLDLMTGDESRGLPSALLLGDKTYLSDSTRRDFSRAGVSHLLAISGLHVTLIFGMLAVFLRLIGVPKRLCHVLLIAGAVGYLVLLGFPPSATRAVVMLGMAYLAYFSRDRADPLTSLGLAGALILAVTPCAVADAGFWMSFLATLGLITLIPLFEKRHDGPSIRELPLWRQYLRRYLTKPAVTLLAGLIAVSFTLSVVAAVIGETSLLSPVSTLLLTPFCALILVLSLATLPLMGTAAGVLLGNLTGCVCTLMTEITAAMAEPSWTVISLRHPAVLPIATVMVAATLVMLTVRLPIRRRFVVLIPILLGWTALGGVLTAHARLTRDEIKATYLQPSAVSDALVLVSGNQGFVCDLSNGSLSSMTAAAREAERQGATELAVYMLTHYHARTSGALSAILERETVRALWMPAPADGEEYTLMLACLEKAESADVPVLLYDEQQPLKLFGDGVLTLETAALARSVHPVLLVSLDVSSHETGKDRLVYCSSAVFESGLAHRAAELVGKADTVIFGGHGPLCKASFGEGLEFAETQEIILTAFGDTAACFDPSDLPPHTPVWQGQKRITMHQ